MSVAAKQRREDAPRTSAAFEAVLADVAASLLDAPLESLDLPLTEALSRLVVRLGVDRGTISLFDPSDGVLRIAHAWAVEGVPPVPLGVSGQEFPWFLRRLMETRQPIILSSLSELPPEASTDLDSARRLGVKSAAMFPIEGGGQILGTFSFGTFRSERSWPQPLVERLHLVGKMLAGALLRREHERALRASLAEVSALRERLQAENAFLREGMAIPEGPADLVGESAALRGALFQIEQVAPTDATVLLLGETGTGKELAALAIHRRSGRRERPLVKVNCAALPATLIESELFGHEKGAFTGAASRKFGRFELADRGTLFLDEIGELPLLSQSKLLRVLQAGEFERLGSPVTHRVDVRVIAASNRDLSVAVREGTFRADLYYRLRVFPIEMPPLRARKEDIPLLVWFFLGELGATLGKKIERVPVSAMDRLVAYDWPGNVRELRNVLERAVILSRGPVLYLEELFAGSEGPVSSPAEPAGSRTLDDVERDYILRVLELCQWRIRGPGNAAERLGLNASTLYSRMKKLRIQHRTAAARGAARS